jgi:ferredoxin--NADP+ reductase
MNELNARVSQRIEVAPHLIILRVVPGKMPLPDFVPGQFALLGLPGSAPRYRYSDPEEKTPDPEKLIKRAYSIASSSVEKQYVEFYITLLRSGALTPRLFALNIGDRVWLSTKFTGMFTLADLPDYVNVIMVATGTGLAPYMSMIRTNLDCQSSQRVAVLHGARHSWDLGYHSELVTMQRLCGNFTYVPIISRPGEEPLQWGGNVGYVQDLWKRKVLDSDWGFHPEPANTHFFLCGNPSMIETMSAVLAGEGFNEHSKKGKGEVHIERYW